MPAASRSSPSATGGARRSVATFDDYAGAQHAVDTLSDRGFPVEHVVIAGTGLRYVEQVSGRLTTGRAALAGAGQGAAVGLFVGLLLGLLFTIEGAFLGLLLYSVALGLVAGTALGAIGHAATGGKRDFASVARMEAERYDVQVDMEFADRASSLLQEMQRTASPGR